MVETCRDCPEIVRNVRPSKGVTRTMTPRRMLTNAKVENIMGVANRYLLATDRKQEGVNETGTPLQGVTNRNPLTGSPKAVMSLNC